MPNDLDKLQGTWHITSLETDGAKMRASQFSDATVVIAGSRFTSLGMGQTYEGTVEMHQLVLGKALTGLDAFR